MSTTISYPTIESGFYELAENRPNRLQKPLRSEDYSFAVKKHLAYTHTTTENLVDALKALKQDAKVLNKADLLTVFKELGYGIE